MLVNELFFQSQRKNRKISESGSNDQRVLVDLFGFILFGKFYSFYGLFWIELFPSKAHHWFGFWIGVRFVNTFRNIYICSTNIYFIFLVKNKKRLDLPIGEMRILINDMILANVLIDRMDMVYRWNSRYFFCTINLKAESIDWLGIVLSQFRYLLLPSQSIYFNFVCKMINIRLFSNRHGYSSIYTICSFFNARVELYEQSHTMYNAKKRCKLFDCFKKALSIFRFICEQCHSKLL